MLSHSCRTDYPEFPSPQILTLTWCRMTAYVVLFIQTKVMITISNGQYLEVLRTNELTAVGEYESLWTDDAWVTPERSNVNETAQSVESWLASWERLLHKGRRKASSITHLNETIKPIGHCVPEQRFHKLFMWSCLMSWLQLCCWYSELRSGVLHGRSL